MPNQLVLCTNSSKVNDLSQKLLMNSEAFETDKCHQDIKNKRSMHRCNIIFQFRNSFLALFGTFFSFEDKKIE